MQITGIAALLAAVAGGTVGGMLMAGEHAQASPSVVAAQYSITPPGCLAAVDDARDIADASQQLAALASEYPPLIPGAYDAGYDRSVDKMSGVLSKRKDLDQQLAELEATIRDSTARYAADAAKCPAVQVKP